METHKYIRHEIQGFILWPRTVRDDVWHNRMASFVTNECAGGKIISAGSVRFDHTGKPQCYGRSESLNINSLPEDSELLAKQLGIALL